MTTFLVEEGLQTWSCLEMA